jgi:PAS domain S-box-containing protein
VRGPLEVERVSRAMNQMSAALSSRHRELVATNRHLAESEERFRLLAEHARDVVYRLRLAPELAFEYVSPAAEPILGCAPRELYANPAPPARPRPRGRPGGARLLRGDAGHGATRLRFVRRDGPVVWLEQQSAFIRDGDGRVVALEGFARDVTEHVRADERLEAARAAAEAAMRDALRYGAELDALFATAPVRLVELEALERAPRVNAAAREILGLPGADVGAFDAYLRSVRITHPKKGELGADALPLLRALRGEAIRDELLRIEPLEGAPGRACWISVSAAPVRAPSGEVRGAVAAFVDVTTVVRRDARAVILHRDLAAGSVHGHGDEDLRRGRRVLQRVRDEVRDDLLEPRGVGEDDRVRARRLDAQAIARERAGEPDTGSSCAAAGSTRRRSRGAPTPSSRARPGCSGSSRTWWTPRGSRRGTSRCTRGAHRAEGLGPGLFITRKLVEAHGWQVRVESVVGQGSTFAVLFPVERPAPRARYAVG